MIKKLSIIFILSFWLNVIWENAHSFLYTGYQGGEITQFILLRASLADAIILTICALPFMYLPYFKNKKWLIIPIGIFIGIVIELFALNTGRWVYDTTMPIIPLLNVGLTPTLQLGILGYLTYTILI